MSVQVSYKKQFALGFLLLLVVLVIAEGIARIYEYDDRPCKWLESDAWEGNYELALQVCLDLTSIEFEFGDIRTYKPNQHFQTFNINSHGFRGPEITKENPENVFRIMIIGGSTANSMGSTSDYTTISGYLQEKFDNENLEKNVEVINAAIGGITSYEETYYVKNYLIEFNPDLIIVYDGSNDARYRLVEESPTFKANYQAGPFNFSDLVIYRTPFVMYNVLIKPIYDLRVVDDLEFKLVENWKNRWLEVCEIGKNEGFSTIITVQPIMVVGNKTLTTDEKTWLRNDKQDETTKEVFKGMANALDEMGESCSKTLDLRGIFDDVKGPLYFDDVHVVDKGNEIAANELFKIVLPLLIKEN